MPFTPPSLLLMTSPLYSNAPPLIEPLDDDGDGISSPASLPACSLWAMSCCMMPTTTWASYKPSFLLLAASKARACLTTASSLLFIARMKSGATMPVSAQSVLPLRAPFLFTGKYRLGECENRVDCLLVLPGPAARAVRAEDSWVLGKT